MLYNDGMEEFPYTCKSCQTINMVSSTVMWSVDKLVRDVGYNCEGCNRFQHLYFTTQSLDDAFRKMASISVKHSKFRFFFFKTLHKTLEVQVKYGS